MPHEIVSTILKNSQISRGMELALDAQWKDLWKQVVEQVKANAAEEGLEFDPTRMVPMCDVSGSMEGVPMEVAIALGIGISEITNEAFRDMVLIFHESPTWFRLNPTDTIVEKVRCVKRARWGMSTDFEKAYDLILDVCLQNKLRRDDMPCLIVFSDMQFDEARGVTGYRYGSGRTVPSTPRTMFQSIQSKVQKVAETLSWEDSEPTPIVFWNLRNTEGYPVDKDTQGTVLLSGFSPSLLKLVMNGEALKEQEVEVVQENGRVVTEKVRVTPEEILLKMLNDPLYDAVRSILGKSTEGSLKEYESLTLTRVDGSSEVVDEKEDFELI
jgi:hypothetical protein